MALPTGKQESNIKAIEEGNYHSRLKAITLQVEVEYESKQFNDGEGLAYQGCTFVWDVDGEEYQDRFIRVSTNPQAKFTNRLEGLLGRALTETDVLEWKIAKGAQTNYALDQYYKASKDDPANGIRKGEYVVTNEQPNYDGIEGAVQDLLVNGESILGRECLLELGVNKKGYNVADSSAASPLPKRATRRTTTAAVQTPDADEEEAVEATPAPVGKRRAAPVEGDEGEEEAAPARGKRRQAPVGAPT
jgi:hypothetical protein